MDSDVSGGSKQQRFTEWAKFLPVAFVVANIGVLSTIYVKFHCFPKLSIVGQHDKAAFELMVFAFFASLVVLCYVLCVLVHPGTLPDRSQDPSWEFVLQEGDAVASVPQSVQEWKWKRQGQGERERRQCKWCARYKPDRCHHCRVCQTCVLKMDHHCVWLYNCVGFRNYKYFFLLLLYSVVCCHMITWTMYETTRQALVPSTPFGTMFALLFGETLAGFQASIVTMFFIFHNYLMLRGMTTIEFCEKATKPGYNASLYDRGIYGNIKAVLGDNVLLWLLPVSPPSGTGLTFVTEEARLAKGGGADKSGARYRAKMQLAADERTSSAGVFMA